MAAAFKHIGRIINLGGIDLGFPTTNAFCTALNQTRAKELNRGLVVWPANGLNWNRPETAGSYSQPFIFRNARKSNPERNPNHSDIKRALPARPQLLLPGITAPRHDGLLGDSFS